MLIVRPNCKIKCRSRRGRRCLRSDFVSYSYREPASDNYMKQNCRRRLRMTRSGGIYLIFREVRTLMNFNYLSFLITNYSMYFF